MASRNILQASAKVVGESEDRSTVAAYSFFKNLDRLLSVGLNGNLFGRIDPGDQQMLAFVTDAAAIKNADRLARPEQAADQVVGRCFDLSHAEMLSRVIFTCLFRKTLVFRVICSEQTAFRPLSFLYGNKRSGRT